MKTKSDPNVTNFFNCLRSVAHVSKMKRVFEVCYLLRSKKSISASKNLAEFHSYKLKLLAEMEK